MLRPLPQGQHQNHLSVLSPGSQIQVCRSHWSEQRLWEGQGDETQGLPTLQPISTLTDLDGRGRGGESGRTPNRTPCWKRARSMFREFKQIESLHHSFIEISLFHTHIFAHFLPLLTIQFIHPYLYASFYPVLNLSRAQHSSHMQMFHLQTMNFISQNYCSLMGRKKARDVRELMWTAREKSIAFNSWIQLSIKLSFEYYYLTM